MNIEYEKAIAYLHGRISAEIEYFCKSLQLPEQDITIRLGTLFFGLSSGEELRTENNLSLLRSKTTKRGEKLRSMEMANDSYNKTQKRKSPIKRKTDWWTRYTKAELKKEMARRSKMRKRKNVKRT